MNSDCITNIESEQLGILAWINPDDYEEEEPFALE